jgi:SAM-dependent methyltransferase
MPGNTAIRCKLCQATSCLHIGQQARRTFIHCPACGLVFVPESEYLTVEGERSRYDRHDNTPSNLGYRRFLSEVADSVVGLGLGEGTVLDFGAGKHAVLTQLLRERGLRARDYDPLYGRGDDALEERYDLVVLCEVIEHLRDLRSELASLRECLRPAGRVLLRTQIYPAVELIADWWYSRDPTHLNFFGEATMDTVAALLGKTTVTRLAADLFLIA